MQPHESNAGGTVLDSVKQLLEGLRRTTEGEILYGLMDRALRRYVGRDGGIEQAFITFLGRVLDNYISKPMNDPVTRIKARVLRQRLAAYLPSATADDAGKDIAASAGPTQQQEIKAQATPPEVAEPEEAAADGGEILPGEADLAQIDATNTDDSTATGEANDIEALQVQLARNVADTLARSREFDNILRTSIANIKQSSGDVDDLRKLLVDGLGDLLQSQSSLDKNLHATTRYLNVIHDDRRRLVNALDKAQRYSLTDELTGLPNRAAFLRQLESEVGRARRYGFSLALALIDLDQLGEINARYGRDAGDAVLNFYSREVMSQFRSYDMVARYGNDEFAVLFPNTQREGAACALEKAQRRAHNISISHCGQSLALPSFSSVLTVYAPGDKPASLLKRVDEALGNAKARGPGQSVVALPTG